MCVCVCVCVCVFVLVCMCALDFMLQYMYTVHSTQCVEHTVICNVFIFSNLTEMLMNCSEEMTQIL